MGRFSGLATALSTVADRLRSQREMGEETRQKQNLLGYEGLIKEKLLEKESALKPKVEAIVDDTGNVIGTRPINAVFQPRPDPTEAIITALGGGENFSKKVFTPSEERITVVSPIGQKGSIPKSQLQDALKVGYKRTIK